MLAHFLSINETWWWKGCSEIGTSLFFKRFKNSNKKGSTLFSKFWEGKAKVRLIVCVTWADKV